MHMHAANDNHIHERLQALANAQSSSLAQMMAVLQQELRGIARGQRRRTAPSETLCTTALINEAYLKLSTAEQLIEQMDHRHFLAVAANAMRHILMNHARDRLAQKRGAGAVHVTLDEANTANAQSVEEASRMVELTDALERLEQVRPRLAQVVQLRFFAGLSEEETGEVLGIDRSTVRRDWVKARGWLHDKLHTDPLP